MELEKKYCAGETGMIVTDGHVVSGYASLFGLTDQGGDAVQPGAYKGSLERLVARGGRVKMLWQHDPAQPIGVWDEVHEDAKGLWVKGRILTDLDKGREAATLIEAGAIDGLSIGYRTVRAEKATHGRKLTELELWEVSLVTFPMLTEARVDGTKGDRPADAALRELSEAFTAARELFHPG